MLLLYLFCQNDELSWVFRHSLKGNQEILHEDVKLYFETAQNEPNFYPLSKTKTSNKNHGRIERREYFLTTDIEWINDKNA